MPRPRRAAGLKRRSKLRQLPANPGCACDFHLRLGRINEFERAGKLTQGEDTADNGGIYLALSALTSDLMQQGKTLEDKDSNGLTNMQRFFLAFANDWCSSARPDSHVNPIEMKN